MTAGEVELTNIRMTNGAEPQAHANPAFTDDASVSVVFNLAIHSLVIP
jgi:hypothetical protein